MKIKKYLVLMIIGAVLLLPTFSKIVSAEGETNDMSIHWQDYNGKKIGVLTGTLMEDIAANNFPDSEYLYFDSYPDLCTALTTGKIDAFLSDEANIRSINYEQPKISYINYKITKQDQSFAFNKNSSESAELCSEFNDFLNEIKADGTFEEIGEIWLGIDEEKKTIDMSDLTGENGTIKIVTTSTDMPWSYIKDGKNVGYDIDLIVRFCRDRGYALEIMDTDFSGRIPAVQSGKCDFSTDMNVTDERKEQVLFSEPTYYGGVVLAVPTADLESANEISSKSVPEYQTFEELNGTTISMLTGAPFESLISSKVQNVKEFTYFQSAPDMMLAIKEHKTDAGLMNNAIADLVANRDSELAVFPEHLGETAFGLAFAKGDERCDEWAKVYESISDETKKELWEKWTSADDSIKIIPTQDWPGSNGTVNVAACDTVEPMSYVGQDGEILGLDIETILLIAKELDVHVNFIPMDFSAVLSSIEAGKADIACGSIVITEERKESMDFLEYQPASFVFVVRAKDVDTVDNSFFSKVKESFKKTFIREKRYKLFIDGIITTLTITVSAIVFGSILGFLSYLICRRENAVTKKVSAFVLWFIQGIPVVVLLMILYYIVFAKSDLSGTVVAIIAFTLIFGASVFGMLKMGVGAIDKGQMEAALSLGYSDIRAFFRIILPQAIPHFLPAYKAEVVSLVKATAIVGYIAVQDLTKMGDIVRGRTYEAFFPLIAVAIMYFILGGVIKFIVGRLSRHFDPKRRLTADILKGVNVDD